MDSQDVTQTLDSQALKELKEAIIDFLHRLKDKYPSSSSEKKSFDVFHRVMKFMYKNKQKPSYALIEKYRQSKTTKTFNAFPSFEELKEKIEMIEGDYDYLKEKYSSKPEFIYFFDPDLDIQTKIGTDKDGFSVLE